MFRFIRNGRKQIAACVAVVGVLSIESLLATRVVAATPPQAPVLVAQSMNDRIATLQCGEYTITIAFVGAAGSDTYSYRTRGLFLQNGERDGSDYVFNNNDYEYLVTVIEGGSENRDFGTAKLRVSHYGEPVLTKQCTWD